jgi:hypothetical protein
VALDDLRRFIRRLEARWAPEPVERVVQGDVIHTEAGPLVAVRREYPLSHRHGRVPLGHAGAIPAEVLPLIASPPGAAPPGGGRLLFLDVETTGLAGGTGTYAFLVGVGWLECDRFVVAQYFMRDFDEEPALLAALDGLLRGADGLVTFNGCGFDLPLLETRFILQRRPWAAPGPHLDLLYPARRVWWAHLDDCRLNTLERQVLGLTREDDVPGALIPSLYFEFLRTRRAAPLARVFHHNRADVLSLAALLGWFGQALSGGAVELGPGELAGLGRLWERVDPERSAACYRAALAAGLGGWHAHRVRLRLARWEKRRARWEAACALWEASTRGGFDPRPWEELAKYYEHRRRELARAYALVVEAVEAAVSAGAPPRVLDALARRRRRLERRLRRASTTSG